jgi:hypothetical protein
VLLSFGITVILRHSKVNDVYHIGRFGPWSADEEIVWFDISVDQILLVNRLNPRQLEEELMTKGSDASR